MTRIRGLSFSLKRAIGISGLKTKIARKTRIPTTKGGLERKSGEASSTFSKGEKNVNNNGQQTLFLLTGNSQKKLIMNTEPKIFAQFLATIAWADDEYSALEKNTLLSIAENLNMPELPQEMEHYINQIQYFSGTEVSSSLTEIASLVHADDKEALLAACIQLMGCDNYLADEEISNYFFLARMLGKSNEEAEQLLISLTETKEVILNQ